MATNDLHKSAKVVLAVSYSTKAIPEQIGICQLDPTIASFNEASILETRENLASRNA